MQKLLCKLATCTQFDKNWGEKPHSYKYYRTKSVYREIFQGLNNQSVLINNGLYGPKSKILNTLVSKLHDRFKMTQHLNLILTESKVSTCVKSADFKLKT